VLIIRKSRTDGVVTAARLASSESVCLIYLVGNIPNTGHRKLSSSEEVKPQNITNKSQKMKSLILPVADNMFLSSHATKSLVMYVFNFPFPPPGFGVVHLPSMILLFFIQQV
jgi:hypothetical protein